MASSKSPQLRLLHMRDEIDSLSKELLDLNFEIYRDSYGLRRTVERAIQIVSEAARALPQELRARYPEVPWTEIIAIGNPLRHEYHRIDDQVLWETATVDLPKLQPIIMRMLADFDASPAPLLISTRRLAFSSRRVSYLVIRERAMRGHRLQSLRSSNRCASHLFAAS